jgi:hypothetical protein
MSEISVLKFKLNMNQKKNKRCMAFYFGTERAASIQIL